MRVYREFFERSVTTNNSLFTSFCPPLRFAPLPPALSPSPPAQWLLPAPPRPSPSPPPCPPGRRSSRAAPLLARPSCSCSSQRSAPLRTSATRSASAGPSVRPLHLRTAVAPLSRGAAAGCPLTPAWRLCFFPRLAQVPLCPCSPFLRQGRLLQFSSGCILRSLSRWGGSCGSRSGWCEREMAQGCVEEGCTDSAGMAQAHCMRATQQGRMLSCQGR